MRMRWLLWAVAYLAAPAVPGAEPTWTRIKSGRVELIASAGEKKARDAVLPFERLQNLLGEIVKPRGLAPAPVRVVLFQSKREYEPYRVGEFAVAHSITGQGRDWIVMSGTDSANYSLALRDFTHALIRQRGGVPLWLEEGLAWLYSNPSQNGTHVLIGAVVPNLASAFARGKWIPSSRLMTVKRQDTEYTDKIVSTMFSAQSWALVRLLVLREEYRSRLPRLVRAIEEGQSSEQAFQAVYAITPSQLDHAVDSYVRAERLAGGLFDVEFEKKRPDAQVSALPPAESEAMLADLLAGAGKQEEAAKAYTALAEKEPNRPEASQGLGYLALKKGDRDGALKHFARASSLNSRSVEFYRDYAALLTAAGRADKELQMALERALDLDPNLSDARMRLAQYYLRNEEFALSASHFRLVKDVPEDQEREFVDGMFTACYNAGDREGARAAMQRLRERGTTKADLQSVEKMLLALAQPPQPRPVPSPRGASPSGHLDPDALPKISGRLDRLDCSVKPMRLIATVDGEAADFVIEDAQRIVLRGFGAGSVEFECGALKPEPVAIRYWLDEKSTPPARHVRSIELLKRP